MTTYRTHPPRQIKRKETPKPQDKQVETSERKVIRDEHGRLMKGTATPNPNGRPKGLTLSEAARNALKEIVPTDPKGRTWAEFIISGMLTEAGTRNSRAWRELRELTEVKRLQIDDPAEMLKRRLAELGLTIEDVRHDPIVAEFFRLAGLDVGVAIDESEVVGTGGTQEA